MSSNYIIAIDGPTASGKGTVAKRLAKQFGIACLCTGSIYRGITIYFLDNKIGHDDLDLITRHIDKIKLDIKCAENGETLVSVGGKDITSRLDEIVISRAVAGYAKIPVVRERVKQIQNSIVEGKSIVCEGRDITSVVFPNAKYKFYLTASLSVRAKRRYDQEIANGEVITLKEVKKGIHGRDRMDMNRKVSPLVRVKDAIAIDSSKFNADQTVDKMMKIIKKHEKKTDDFRVPFGGGLLRRFLKLFLYLPYHAIYRTRIYNKKELKKYRGKPVIFAMQHRSNSDVATYFISFPLFKLHFIGKESLFKPGTVVNWFLRALNGFPIRRSNGGNDLAVVRHSLNILKRGEVLAIFPEGRRNFDSESALEIQPGTAVIATRSGAPVIPIVTNRAARPFKRNRIKVGTALYAKDFTTRDEFTQKIKDDMMAMLNGWEHKPRQKKWDKTPVLIARGIIFKDGKLVVLKRVKNGETYYVFPGGHIDEGEISRDAAVREVKEETNVACVAVRPLYKSPHASGMNVFYLCSYKSGEVSKTDAEEYSEGYENQIGLDGLAKGTFEPMLLDVAEIGNVDLKPNVVRDQLVKDIKRYGTHLTRQMIYVK